MPNANGQHTDAENSKAPVKSTVVSGGEVKTTRNQSAQAIAREDQRDVRQGADQTTANVQAGS